jgi:hypothetical protein
VSHPTPRASCLRAPDFRYSCGINGAGGSERLAAVYALRRPRGAIAGTRPSARGPSYKYSIVNAEESANTLYLRQGFSLKIVNYLMCTT